MTINRFFNSTRKPDEILNLLQSKDGQKFAQGLEFLRVEVPNLLKDGGANNTLLLLLTPLLNKPEIVEKILVNSPHDEFGNLHIYLTYVMMQLKPDFKEKKQMLMGLLNRYQNNALLGPCLDEIIVKLCSHSSGFLNMFPRDNELLQAFTTDRYEAMVKKLSPAHSNVSTLLSKKMKNLVFTPKISKSFSADLSEHYGETANTSLDRDLIECARFLTNQDLVMKQLAKLESQLRALAKDRFDTTSNKLHLYEEGKEYKHDKLLSNYLYEWAKNNGFAGIAVLRGELEPAEFYRCITQCLLFKDAHFRNTEHGEWSHFIQWWLITEGNKEYNFLKNKPSELLSWIGENSSTKPNLWNSTFEVSPELDSTKGTTFDVRSVISLHNFLTSEDAAKEFPVLHQLIKGRSLKPGVNPEKGICETRMFKKTNN